MIEPPENDGVKEPSACPYSNLLGDGRRSKWVSKEVKEKEEVKERRQSVEVRKEKREPSG
jgi:hypothetical protein